MGIWLPYFYDFLMLLIFYCYVSSASDEKGIDVVYLSWMKWWRVLLFNKTAIFRYIVIVDQISFTVQQKSMIIPETEVIVLSHELFNYFWRLYLKIRSKFALHYVGCHMIVDITIVEWFWSMVMKVDGNSICFY